MPHSLHSFTSLKESLNAGVLEVRLPGSNRNLSIAELDTMNGVITVQILQRNGQWTRNKDIFPKNWTDSDIISAIVEASSVRLPRDRFSKEVTRQGITIPVSGYLENNLISAGFPGNNF